MLSSRRGRGYFSKLLVDCAGHYGHIKLELPVFHIGYFKHTLTTLQVGGIVAFSCLDLLVPLVLQSRFGDKPFEL